MRLASVVTLAALAALAAGSAHAMQPTPLPAFEVAKLDGLPVASSALGSAGKWLLVYVRPASPTSQRLLRLVRKEEDAGAAAHIVVIVGGSLAETQKVCDSFPGLASAAWYADPDDRASTALDIKGAPSAVGLRDRSMEWKLVGVPADPRTVRSILLSWVAE